MSNRRMLLFWKYMYGAPLFEHVVGLVFPIATTAVFTSFITLALNKISVTIPKLAPIWISLAILFSVFLFFIILWLQQLILSTLFNKSLNEYLYRTKNRHPVTKIFGAEILNRFLSHNFKPEMVEGIESLSYMLEKIEQPNGQPLALVSYAILLDKASTMEPDKLLAVWDFGTVPIEKVFSDDGKPRSDYGFYFETLSKIYSKIMEPRNKLRIFLFDNDNHRNTVQQHPGWKSLLKMLGDWKIKGYYYGDIEILKGIQKTVAFEMEDFVWFEVSGRFMSQSWIIGFDREQKIASLRHGEYVMKDVKTLFRRLIDSCNEYEIKKGDF